ncbi:MAG: DNA repair protein RecN [Erysipelotrichia bacterium]|nr:DNA repair protein RecN [Erysipelotrichia bacterium]HQA85311.1 DNA repair protein RecN [Erysipelotrichaceae bacterium]
MLNNLYIKDFILIDELNIDFKNDFSVFTGETGAGKSIFIDCIGCLIGDQLNVSMIRKDCEKTIIEGSFEIDDNLKVKLKEAGYDDESFIVTREIGIDGRSITRLNQRTTTLSFVKECLEDYVDIHCQHDNQYLLNEKYHLSLLDQYCQFDENLKNLADFYKEYYNLEKEYEKLTSTTFNQAQLEIIEYQLREIENLNIDNIEEDIEIQSKLKVISEFEKQQKTIAEIKELFTEDGILDKLYYFTKLSHNLSNFEDVQTNIDNIINSYYSITDDYETILSKLDLTDISTEEIDYLNSRLYDLQRIKRKYNSSLKELITIKEDLSNQLEAYNNKEFILSKLLKEKDIAYRKYYEYAIEVSNFRKNKALKLQKEILNELKDLSLEKAKFEVLFEENKPTSKGIDSVKFMISMNTGMPLQPLNKVASGGELSRLMLGLKVIFAKLQGTKLIIFDEIDAGVSGYVALNIGVKMSKLAKDIQVFGVTHLPSVAACGKYHYLISKVQTDTSTSSTVEEIKNHKRVEQLAILSSSTISETSLSAAKELLEKAQKLCK